MSAVEERMVVSINGTGPTVCINRKKNFWALIPCIKLPSKWVIDLNMNEK